MEISIDVLASETGRGGKGSELFAEGEVGGRLACAARSLDLMEREERRRLLLWDAADEESPVPERARDWDAS